ncbi:glycosyltransferase family 4 protein [Klebsiella spallanzanii]|uniref:glycosyltransferase family 4 protein n=1 Tax=Klebsiella spallanzanii TaxID=2587528 RepID=UPI001158AD0F|nr:glycosyltransferase family 4 protein [Klebsiella spallanzanii]VUT02256.1 Alpha-galactosylglucosyldiacylglycerol synthase [Klebsiella spallanzanii]
MYIIHEYGEPSHYSGAIKGMAYGDRITYVEFSFFKLMYKRIKQRNIKLVFKTFYDLFFLFFLFLFPRFLSRQKVILGIAPQDYRLFFIARALKYAVVIYHTSWADWGGGNFPKKYFFSSSLLEKKWRRFLEQKVSAFAVVTDNVKLQITKNFDVNPDRIFVVYHSFDETMFNIREKSTCSSSKLSVIYAGRFVPEKGILEILNAASQLPNCLFYFMGYGVEEIYIKDYAAKYDNIILLGYLKDKEKIAHFYKKSDVFILPSKRKNGWEEVFGMALIESMACGCAPISTAHIGPKSIIKNTYLNCNFISETNITSEVINLLNNLNNNRCELEKQQKIASDIASEYSLENISSIWNSLFSFVDK